MPHLTPGASSAQSARHTLVIAQGEPGKEKPAEGTTHAGKEAAEEHRAGELPPANLLFANAIVVVLIMVGLSILFTRRLEAVPKGIGNFGEWLAEQMRNFTVGIIGPEGEKHVPLVGTVFYYILLMNLIGLIPGFHSPTSNITTTLALGVFVFLYVQYWGIRNNGLGGYLRHFMGPSMGGKKNFPHLFFLLGPIELFSEIIKPFTLAVRLFGNIFGEDVIIVVLAGLGATFGLSVAGQGFLPLHVPVVFLSLITDLVQAMVFSILTCIYLSLLSPHGHHEEHDEHTEHGTAEAAH